MVVVSGLGFYFLCHLFEICLSGIFGQILFTIVLNHATATSCFLGFPSLLTKLLIIWCLEHCLNQLLLLLLTVLGLSCSTWGLVSWGTNVGLPHWEHGASATEPPGKSLDQLYIPGSSPWKQAFKGWLGACLRPCTFPVLSHHMLRSYSTSAKAAPGASSL